MNYYLLETEIMANATLSTYTWGFSDEYNPTSISVFATSEGHARELALVALDTIAKNKEKYLELVEVAREVSRASRDYSQQTPEWDAVHTFWQSLGIDPKLGCYCRGIEGFAGPDQVIATECGERTLREIIAGIPVCRPFCGVIIASCLDG